MVGLYPGRWSILSTGGAIGDALFFFCSGFLLMMGKQIDFFNWYKRRVNRIFPAIFAVAILGIAFLEKNPTLKGTILNGGGWFVQAIFLFYALFWFVKKYLNKKQLIAYAIDCIVILIWFIWFWNKDAFFLLNGTYLRWACYFLIMLMGASVYSYESEYSIQNKRYMTGWFYVIILFVLLIVYYGYQILMNHYMILKDIQIVLLPVLMSITYMIYRICSNLKLQKIYQSKYVYWAVYGISACCLEIYLSGKLCFWLGKKMIDFFPLNIIILKSATIIQYTIKGRFMSR